MKRLIFIILMIIWRISSLSLSCDYNVAVGESIQETIDLAEISSTICIESGIHREQTIEPKDQQIIIGKKDDVIISGSRLIDSSLFVYDGNENYWVINDQTQDSGYGNGHGSCMSINKIDFLNIDGTWKYHHPRNESLDEYFCNYKFDLYMDDKFLWRIDDINDLRSGSWLFDEDLDIIYMFDDPNGHKIETSISFQAFRGSAKDVTIKNLIVEKYACRAQEGAITMGENWVLDGVEVRLVHGTGIRIGDFCSVKNCYIHHNGQIGIGGVGKGLNLFYNSELSYNAVRGYNGGWEAGASKWVKTDNLVVRHNYCHHNYGNGFWTDIDNVNVLYEDNLIVYNSGEGIKHEISCAAVIRNNDIRFNGWGFDVWLWGAGILAQNSRDVEAYGNYIVIGEKGGDGLCCINQNRGAGECGNWTTENSWFHHNKIVHLKSGENGMVDDTGEKFCTHNNNFDYNTYYLPDITSSRFEFCEGRITFDEFQSLYNQEIHGQVLLLTDEIIKEANNIPRFKRENEQLRIIFSIILPVLSGIVFILLLLISCTLICICVSKGKRRRKDKAFNVTSTDEIHLVSKSEINE